MVRRESQWVGSLHHISFGFGFICESFSSHLQCLNFCFLGAIFFENEQEIELSFDHALREVNNLKFFEIQFVSIKRYMPTNDSFMLQQLSKCFHRSDRIPNIKCWQNIIFRLACELISNGVAAIFGPSSKAASGTLCGGCCVVSSNICSAIVL